MRARHLTMLAILACCSTLVRGSAYVNVEFDRATLKRHDPLRFRVREVHLRDVNMFRALTEIQNAIERDSHGMRRVLFECEPAGQNLRDPTVTVEGNALTLRQLLDLLCRQAGWSYSSESVGLFFSDSQRNGQSVPDPRAAEDQGNFKRQ